MQTLPACPSMYSQLTCITHGSAMACTLHAYDAWHTNYVQITNTQYKTLKAHCGLMVEHFYVKTGDPSCISY